MSNRYVEPLGGPGDANVRPPDRRGPVAWVAAVIVAALVIAFLVLNRVEDVPPGEPRPTSTVPRSAP